MITYYSVYPIPTPPEIVIEVIFIKSDVPAGTSTCNLVASVTLFAPKAVIVLVTGK